MTVHERIKYLRKGLLKLTQETFASGIHISRATLASVEVGRINVTDRVASDICRIYSVNPEWLSRGTEPVFTRDRDAVLDEITETYAKLTEQNRAYLKGYINRLLDEQNNRQGREGIDD